MTYRALSVEEVRRKLREDEPLSLTEMAYADARPEIGDAEFARAIKGEESAEVDDGRIQTRVTDF